MKTKSRRVKRVPNEADVPKQPREIPTFCPLFPTVRCASVGKVVLQAIEYDDTGEEHRQHIVHQRITPEMDEADIAAIAGGGEYYVAVHKNDGSGQMISHRKLEIFGPPKEFDDDDFDDDGKGGKGKPTVINVPGGEPIIVPSNLKGPEQQAFIAQQQHLRSLQKQAEGNGGNSIASVVGAMMQMQMKSSESTTQLMVAMMGRPTGDPASQQAMLALQGQLNAANTEKASLIAQHGAALNALREEHSATMASLRTELAKALDEGRRLTGLIELRVEEARANARKAASEDIAKLRSEIARLEQALLGSERNALRIQSESRASSETVELAKLAFPVVKDMVSGAGGDSKLAKRLEATADAIDKEILPTVRKLNAHPLLQPVSDDAEPHVEAEPDPEPVPVTAPTPAASNGAAIAVPVPDMPG